MIKSLNQTGQIFILAVVVVTLILINTVVIIGSSLLFSQNSKYSTTASQATSLAEAGIDKAVASLNATGGTYGGEAETALTPGSYTVEITSKDSTTKIVTATGYVPNKTSPVSKRAITIQVSKGTGTAFNYALQAGEGGFTFGNTSRISGSVYSNGNIIGGNGNVITGDAWVAGGSQPNADQQSDCISPNCQDFIFGKNVSGNNQLDVAQSFKPSVDTNLNKVAIKLKKFGSPPDLTVRLLADNAGKPDKSSVKASGVLSSSLVTTTYSFVDVTFSSSPSVLTDTTYWIMIDTSSNSSNYWSWSDDTTQGYTRGSSAWSPNWQASTPIWNSISGDLGFQAYVGGVATKIDLGNGSVIEGDAHANTITGGNGVIVKGSAYYQVLGSAVAVQGTKYPNSPDSPPKPMPISEANIAEWKDEALAAGIINGNITGCPSSIGPGKVVGNVTLSGSCHISVKTPLWITGNIITGSSTVFTLDSSFGGASGNIITDGIIDFGNGADIKGTGVAGSYMMMLTTYNSKTNGVVAINTGNSSITGILYAGNGIIDLPNGGMVKEMTAWRISLGNNSNLNYDSGLSGVFFSSGPSGAYSAIKGTYQAK
jgi:hypothetical protein